MLKIKYIHNFAFLFWWIIDISKTKKAAIVKSNDNVKIKTNKFEGEIEPVSKIGLFFYRYFLAILFVMMFFVATTNLVMAFFIYGGGFFLYSIFLLFKKNKSRNMIYMLTGYILIFATLYLTVVYKLDLSYSYQIKNLFNIFSVFMSIMVSNILFVDIEKNKNYEFYRLKKQKLFIFFNKEHLNEK